MANRGTNKNRTKRRKAKQAEAARILRAKRMREAKLHSPERRAYEAKLALAVAALSAK